MRTSLIKNTLISSLSVVFLLAFPQFLHARNFRDVLRRTPAEIEGESQQIQVVQTKLSTENGRTAKPGEVQIKFMYQWREAKKRWDRGWDLHGRGLKAQDDLNLNLVFGLVPNLEMSTNMSYQYVTNKNVDGEVQKPEKGDGLSVLPVNFKWRFYESKKHKVSFVYVPGFTIPTGPVERWNQVGVVQTYASFDETLALTKNWDRWTLSADSGYSLPFGARRQNNRGALTSNVALGYQVHRHLQPEVEINYKHRFYDSAADSNAFAMTAGLLAPFYPRMLLMAGVQQVLFGNNTDRDLLVKTAIKFYL